MISYRELAHMMENGAVKSFDECFQFIQQKKFSRDTGISAPRLKTLRAHPTKTRLDELIKITSLLDISPNKMFWFMLQ